MQSRGKSPLRRAPTGGLSRASSRTLLAFAVLAGIPGSTYASPSGEHEDSRNADITSGPVAGRPLSWLTVEGSFDCPSAYIFRGYNIHDTGVQAQPSLTFSTDLVQGALTITPSVGLWTNLTSQAFGHGRWKHCDELDLMGAVAFLTAGTSCQITYFSYSSPSHFAGRVTELGVTLSREPTEETPRSASLCPHFGIFQELSDAETHNLGTYIEAGLEPRLDLAVADTSVVVSFPVTWGGGFNSYYTEAGGRSTPGGYVAAGLRASYPLLGTLDLQGEVDLYHLISDSVREANHGRTTLFVMALGVGCSF
jgi:hypothetical protein